MEFTWYSIMIPCSLSIHKVRITEQMKADSELSVTLQNVYTENL